MGRLIDADKLIKDVLDLPNCENGFSDTYDKATIIAYIDEQPTVDAEPIVRCKDCAYWGEHYEQGCGMADYKTEPNHFCSWGERKK